MKHTESRSQLAGRAIYYWQKAKEEVVANIIADLNKGNLTQEVADGTLRLANEKYDALIERHRSVLAEIEMN